MKSTSLDEIKLKVDALEREILLLRPIFEVIQDPFFILDQKGEFLKTNLKGMELLRYSWEDLQQMLFIDIVAIEDISKIREGYERMDEGKEVRMRMDVVSRSGERIPVEFIGTLRGMSASLP